MTGETLRVFSALNLPDELHRRLGEIVARLQQAAPRGDVRWVRPAGIHLTLKFYGEVSPARLPDLQRVVTQAASDFGPLAFTLSGLGAFPNANRPRVVWVGLAGDVPALLRLQRAVEDGSARVGFPPEARPFKPHLTLGRVNQPLSQTAHSALAQTLRREMITPGEPFVLEALTLWRSELRPGGPVYTPLFSSPLGRSNHPAMLELDQ